MSVIRPANTTSLKQWINSLFAWAKHVLRPHRPHARSDFGPADIAEARRRLKSEGPRYTTQEVLEHLRSLKGQ